MKKRHIILLSLILFLSVASIAFAEERFDLSSMTYDELVTLKDKINLAIWNSQEWQEVIVPQGVWLVGKDIPEGHWSISCAGGYCTSLRFGTCLDETGHSIDAWNTEFYFSDNVYGTDSVLFDPVTDKVITDVELKDGTYVIIQTSNAVFTPYSGKPSLGFK